MQLRHYYRQGELNTIFEFLMVDSNKKLVQCPYKQKGYIWLIAEFLYLSRSIRLSKNADLYRFNTVDWSKLSIFCYLKSKKVIILNECIFPGYDYLANFLHDRLILRLEEYVKYLGVGLIGFIIVSILSFVLGWLPFISKKRHELMQVRSFIGLLPLELIVKMKGFRNFFAQVVFTHSK